MSGCLQKPRDEILQTKPPRAACQSQREGEREGEGEGGERRLLSGLWIIAKLLYQLLNPSLKVQ